MPVNDDIRAEKKKFKNMDSKERVQYIWDYYKIPIIAGLLAFIFIFFLVRDIISNNRETHLYACLINSNYAYDTDTNLINEYVNYADIDTEAEQLTLDFSMRIDLDAADQMSMAYQQKVMALFAAKEIDVMIGDEPIINSYAEVEAFRDLSELLPTDLAEELKEKGYSYYTITDADGTDIPFGIYMEHCGRFLSDGSMGTYPTDVTPVFTIAVDAPHPENAIEFLRFLISKDSSEPAK